jgi:hypothetical protein
METEPQFRQPTEGERALLMRLLEAEFPGKDELAPMIHNLRVKTVCEDGTLELMSQARGKANVIKRIPVEAEAKDEDGVVVHVLLHVVGGRPIELEVYKDDGSPVKRMPPASAFELIVLPPAPSRS